MIVVSIKFKGRGKSYFFDPNGIDVPEGAQVVATRGGVATALISIPNRYMHSQVEICDLRDAEGAVKILTETIAALKGNEKFIPGE